MTDSFGWSDEMAEAEALNREQYEPDVDDEGDCCPDCDCLDDDDE